MEKTFDLKRLPTKVARQVQSLREGDFVDRKENLLGFGKPGSGNTSAKELVHVRQSLSMILTSLGNLPSRRYLRAVLGSMPALAVASLFEGP